MLSESVEITAPSNTDVCLNSIHSSVTKLSDGNFKFKKIKNFYLAHRSPHDERYGGYTTTCLTTFPDQVREAGQLVSSLSDRVGDLTTTLVELQYDQVDDSLLSETRVNMEYSRLVGIFRVLFCVVFLVSIFHNMISIRVWN